ncbi:hypothetical protein RHS01_08424 [Rhizoctonia solani]|uniref:Reverse transcriptase n=1 Tax=Rhizoctonia solani TaxID=456999 RepID=A0A8H7M241_9AGAM|nr:hypothetical protein RHS01_08424 [Rhizoctonia solani]
MLAGLTPHTQWQPLEPPFPPASPELGKVSLERVIRLLWGLQSQVDCIERTLLEQAKVSQEDGLAQLQHARGPHTPEEQKPPRLRKLPGLRLKPSLLARLNPSLGPQPPSSPQGSQAQPPLLIQPISLLLLPFRTGSSSPGTSTSACHYPAQPPVPSTVKVDHPDAFKGKIGLEAKQWLTRMLAWVHLNQRQFPLDMEVLSFLLMNMTEAAGAWAHPHLDQLGSHCALIQTMDEFKTKFLAAFGNPNATRAAERKITSLTQTGTCAKYITKFRTLQMELNWNDAALCGQFARGLHWEVQRQIATRERQPQTLRELQDASLIIDNALRKERASHPPQGNKSGKSSATPNRGASTGQQATKPGPLSSNPNYVLEEEQNCRRAEGLCVKCGKTGHKFAKCRTGWRATPKSIKGAKETAKIGKDSKYQSGKDPQAGKIWKKTTLTFSLDNKQMTKTFLICNTGSHAAILGLKWLDAHNPEIDWNSQEEANKNPLKGVPSKYHKYAKVFGEEEFNKLPPHRHYNIGIELTEEGPLNFPLYSMTDAKSATLKDWLRDKLKAGKIRPSKSSISSPVMFVPKKDGSRQLVVDYRRLNNRTKKNVYPLPRPDDLMAQLCGAKVFSKLDLRWGYNNVQVKEGDEWKTAFCTKYGLYKSLVMTFGLTNAPATFQHFMNKLFKDLLDVCVIIYLDDILIYSKDDASHTRHIHEVLRQLMENQLFCKASKCTFHITSVEYLGIIVSDKGFSLDKLKIQAVQEWPTPTKVKEVQSFLGFANFLQRFVANFSHMARPLHNLNYNTHNKELLAIIRSFEYWHIFLEGTLHPITVFTNHWNLEYWKESRTFNCRHARWHLLLAGYNFQIVYRPGKQSGKPDALSRRSNHANIPPANQTMLPEPVFANTALVTPERELQRQIKAALDQDESLEEILQFLQNKSKAPPSIKRAFKDYQMEAGLLFYQGQIVVPDLATPGGNGHWIWSLGTTTGLASVQIRTGMWIPAKPANKSGSPSMPLFRRNPLSSQPDHGKHISYDMIVDLPKDGSNDSILVIVDSFTKYGIFVKCSKKLKAPELAELFLEHVWKQHGMPEKTVLDREGDGQTERVNPSIKHFLRAYSGVNQRDWTKWLPMAEFAYNNAVHSSTGKTPFKALYGWEPTLTPSNVPTDVPEADNLAQTMEEQWKEVESALRQSKQQMVAGENGNPTEFKIGEEVWLDAKNVKLKTLSPKLTEQRLGPFKVVEKISNRAYRLELPLSMRIHNVFYVGLLSKVKRDDKRTFENRPPPVTVDGEEEYEVEGITNAKERDGKWFF